MKLSGYTYVKNAIEMNYPFEASIRSLIDCCDEVVVIDASTKNDGTSEALRKLVKEFSETKLIVFEYNEIDWTAPNHGIWDGKLKAIARNQCTGDFLLQLDSDEIIEENARPKIENLIGQLKNMEQISLVAIPIVEYWGSAGKVRIDVNPWKWRISKNDPNITHGIPSPLRKIEPNGLLYSMPGSDGCDYIYETSGEVVPCANFINNDVETVRRAAILDSGAKTIYEQWFNIVVNELPTIYHFSWWSVREKINKYEKYWNAHWLSLYNEKKPEGWNPFFLERKISEVSEEDKLELARKLELETSGHIFHTAWDGTKTNSVTITKPYPKLVEEWCRENKTK